MGVRRLLTAEPEAGSLLPETALHAIGQLVGCDYSGISETDRTGYRLRGLTFPSMEMGDPQVCDGPLPTGLIHDADQPDEWRDAPELGLRDLLRLGFPTDTARSPSSTSRAGVHRSPRATSPCWP